MVNNYNITTYNYVVIKHYVIIKHYVVIKYYIYYVVIKHITY